MKYMTMKKYAFNLQLFADEGSQDGAESDDNSAGQDDEIPDEEDNTDEKKYSQKDVDETVRKRLARERRKWQRKQEETEKDSSKDVDSEKSEVSKDAKARKEAESKVSQMEVKLACFEADVAKESVDDVAALAKAYMEADADLDLEDAIEKVVKKYPSFKKGSGDPYEEEEAAKNKSWGQRQTGKGLKKTDGVEAAFLKRNPGLKID